MTIKLLNRNKGDGSVNWLFSLGRKKLLIIYVIADLFCVGLGMGVPMFSILLGFPVGWFLTKKLYASDLDMKYILNRIFKYALISSAFTMLLMILIWGSIIPMIWDPKADLANFGIPLILYDPKLSFIGWLILMIVISPFFQLMSAVFTAFITLMKMEEPISLKS
jgi:hypothetical protein